MPRTLSRGFNNAINQGHLGMPPGGNVIIYLDVELNVQVTPAFWAGFANVVNVYRAGPHHAFTAGIYTPFVRARTVNILPKRPCESASTVPTSIGPTPYRFVRASGQAVSSLARYVRSRHMCPTGTGSEVIRSPTSIQPIRYSTTYGSTRKYRVLHRFRAGRVRLPRVR